MKLYLTGEPCTQQRHCYFVEGETASFIMDCGYQRCYRGDELPHLLRLSRRMMTTIKCNLTFSMTLNFAAIVLAITGVLNPVIGALVHNARGADDGNRASASAGHR